MAAPVSDETWARIEQLVASALRRKARAERAAADSRLSTPQPNQEVPQ